MAPDPRIDANRRNWDDRVPIHLGSEFYGVDRWIAEQRGPREEEARLLGDVTGLDLVHLQCHFGLDTLQWARAGAVVTGLDFSAPAIDAARDLATRSGLADRARFVCADVHEAVQVLGAASFDIVYVSLGALCWLPSADRWAEQVSGLLRPAGRLYLHEGHPAAWSMDDDEPRLRYTYFEDSEALHDEDANTYTDAAREETLANPGNYQWNHSLAETVTAVQRHGLRLTMLEEHDWSDWKAFPWLVDVGQGRWGPPPGSPRWPLSFTLMAAKEG